MIIPVFILGIILMVHASNTGDDPDRNGTGGNYDYTDRDAPKTIASKDISSFVYSFPPMI